MLDKSKDLSSNSLWRDFFIHFFSNFLEVIIVLGQVAWIHKILVIINLLISF